MYEVHTLRDNYFTFSATHCNRIEAFKMAVQPPSIDKNNKDPGEVTDDEGLGQDQELELALEDVSLDTEDEKASYASSR